MRREREEGMDCFLRDHFTITIVNYYNGVKSKGNIESKRVG